MQSPLTPEQLSELDPQDLLDLARMTPYGEFPGDTEIDETKPIITSRNGRDSATEETRTLQIQDKSYLVPTIHGGKRLELSDDEDINNLWLEDLVLRGKILPVGSYASPEVAGLRAKHRSEAIGATLQKRFEEQDAAIPFRGFMVPTIDEAGREMYHVLDKRDAEKLLEDDELETPQEKVAKAQELVEAGKFLPQQTFNTTQEAFQYISQKEREAPLQEDLEAQALDSFFKGTIGQQETRRKEVERLYQKSSEGLNLTPEESGILAFDRLLGPLKEGATPLDEYERQRALADKQLVGIQESMPGINKALREINDVGSIREFIDIVEVGSESGITSLAHQAQGFYKFSQDILHEVLPTFFDEAIHTADEKAQRLAERNGFQEYYRQNGLDKPFLAQTGELIREGDVARLLGYLGGVLYEGGLSMLPPVLAGTAVAGIGGGLAAGGRSLGAGFLGRALTGAGAGLATPIAGMASASLAGAGQSGGATYLETYDKTGDRDLSLRAGFTAAAITGGTSILMYPLMAAASSRLGIAGGQIGSRTVDQSWGNKTMNFIERRFLLAGQASTKGSKAFAGALTGTLAGGLGEAAQELSDEILHHALVPGKSLDDLTWDQIAQIIFVSAFMGAGEKYTGLLNFVSNEVSEQEIRTALSLAKGEEIGTFQSQIIEQRKKAIQSPITRAMVRVAGDSILLDPTFRLPDETHWEDIHRAEQAAKAQQQKTGKLPDQGLRDVQGPVASPDAVDYTKTTEGEESADFKAFKHDFGFATDEARETTLRKYGADPTALTDSLLQNGMNVGRAKSLANLRFKIATVIEQKGLVDSVSVENFNRIFGLAYQSALGMVKNSLDAKNPITIDQAVNKVQYQVLNNLVADKESATLASLLPRAQEALGRKVQYTIEDIYNFYTALRRDVPDTAQRVQLMVDHFLGSAPMEADHAMDQDEVTELMEGQRFSDGESYENREGFHVETLEREGDLSDEELLADSADAAGVSLESLEAEPDLLVDEGSEPTDASLRKLEEDPGYPEAQKLLESEVQRLAEEGPEDSASSAKSEESLPSEDRPAPMDQVLQDLIGEAPYEKRKTARRQEAAKAEGEFYPGTVIPMVRVPDPWVYERSKIDYSAQSGIVPPGQAVTKDEFGVPTIDNDHQILAQLFNWGYDLQEGMSVARVDGDVADLGYKDQKRPYTQKELNEIFEKATAHQERLKQLQYEKFQELDGQLDRLSGIGANLKNSLFIGESSENLTPGASKFLLQVGDLLRSPKILNKKLQTLPTGVISGEERAGVSHAVDALQNVIYRLRDTELASAKAQIKDAEAAPPAYRGASYRSAKEIKNLTPSEKYPSVYESLTAREKRIFKGLEKVKLVKWKIAKIIEAQRSIIRASRASDASYLAGWNDIQAGFLQADSVLQLASNSLQTALEGTPPPQLTTPKKLEKVLELQKAFIKRVMEDVGSDLELGKMALDLEVYYNVKASREPLIVFEAALTKKLFPHPKTKKEREAREFSDNERAATKLFKKNAAEASETYGAKLLDEVPAPFRARDDQITRDELTQIEVLEAKRIQLFEILEAEQTRQSMDSYVRVKIRKALLKGQVKTEKQVKKELFRNWAETKDTNPSLTEEDYQNLRDAREEELKNDFYYFATGLAKLFKLDTGQDPLGFKRKDVSEISADLLETNPIFTDNPLLETGLVTPSLTYPWSFNLSYMGEDEINPLTGEQRPSQLEVISRETSELLKTLLLDKNATPAYTQLEKIHLNGRTPSRKQRLVFAQTANTHFKGIAEYAAINGARNRFIQDFFGDLLYGLSNANQKRKDSAPDKKTGKLSPWERKTPPRVLPTYDVDPNNPKDIPSQLDILTKQHDFYVLEQKVLNGEIGPPEVEKTFEVPKGFEHITSKRALEAARKKNPEEYPEDLFWGYTEVTRGAAGFLGGKLKPSREHKVMRRVTKDVVPPSPDMTNRMFPSAEKATKQAGDSQYQKYIAYKQYQQYLELGKSFIWDALKQESKPHQTREEKATKASFKEVEKGASEYLKSSEAKKLEAGKVTTTSLTFQYLHEFEVQKTEGLKEAHLNSHSRFLKLLGEVAQEAVSRVDPATLFHGRIPAFRKLPIQKKKDLRTFHLDKKLVDKKITNSKQFDAAKRANPNKYKGRFWVTVPATKKRAEQSGIGYSETKVARKETFIQNLLHEIMPNFDRLSETSRNQLRGALYNYFITAGEYLDNVELARMPFAEYVATVSNIPLDQVRKIATQFEDNRHAAIQQMRGATKATIQEVIKSLKQQGAKKEKEKAQLKKRKEKKAELLKDLENTSKVAWSPEQLILSLEEAISVLDKGTHEDTKSDTGGYPNSLAPIPSNVDTVAPLLPLDLDHEAEAADFRKFAKDQDQRTYEDILARASEIASSDHWPGYVSVPLLQEELNLTPGQARIILKTLTGQNTVRYKAAGKAGFFEFVKSQDQRIYGKTLVQAYHIALEKGYVSVPLLQEKLNIESDQAQIIIKTLYAQNIVGRLEKVLPVPGAPPPKATPKATSLARQLRAAKDTAKKLRESFRIRYQLTSKVQAIQNTFIDKYTKELEKKGVKLEAPIQGLNLPQLLELTDILLGLNLGFAEWKPTAEKGDTKEIVNGANVLKNQKSRATRAVIAMKNLIFKMNPELNLEEHFSSKEKNKIFPTDLYAAVFHQMKEFLIDATKKPDAATASNADIHLGYREILRNRYEQVGKEVDALLEKIKKQFIVNSGPLTEEQQIDFIENISIIQGIAGRIARRNMHLDVRTRLLDSFKVDLHEVQGNEKFTARVHGQLLSDPISQRYVIQMFKTGGVETLVHENAHLLRKVLSVADLRYVRRIIGMNPEDEWQDFHQGSGITFEERFASLMEGWTLRFKTRTPKEQKIYTKIKNWVVTAFGLIPDPEYLAHRMNDEELYQYSFTTETGVGTEQGARTHAQVMEELQYRTLKKWFVELDPKVQGKNPSFELRKGLVGHFNSLVLDSKMDTLDIDRDILLSNPSASRSILQDVGFALRLMMSSSGQAYNALAHGFYNPYSNEIDQIAAVLKAGGSYDKETREFTSVNGKKPQHKARRTILHFQQPLVLINKLKDSVGQQYFPSSNAHEYSQSVLKFAQYQALMKAAADPNVKKASMDNTREKKVEQILKDVSPEYAALLQEGVDIFEENLQHTKEFLESSGVFIPQEIQDADPYRLDLQITKTLSRYSQYKNRVLGGKSADISNASDFYPDQGDSSSKVLGAMEAIIFLVDDAFTIGNKNRAHITLTRRLQMAADPNTYGRKFTSTEAALLTLSQRDKLQRVFTQDANGDPIIEYWLYTPAIQQYFEALDPNSIEQNPLMRMLEVSGELAEPVTRLKKFFITHGIPFLHRNPTRDLQSAAIQSRIAQKIGAWAYLKNYSGSAIKEAVQEVFLENKKFDFTEDVPLDTFIRELSGGGFVDVLATHQNYSDTLATHMARFSETGKDFVVTPGTVDGIIRNLRAVRDKIPILKYLKGKNIAASESLTRNVEFRATYDELIKQGVDPIEARMMAVSESLDLLDYAKVGYAMRHINKIVLFSNAGVQGLWRTIRSFAENPGAVVTPENIARNMPRVFGAWFLYVVAPRLFFRLLSLGTGEDDEDEDYRQQDAASRDYFITVPYNILPGFDGPSNFRLRFPQPFEHSVLAAGVDRAIDKFILDDPNAFKGYSRSVYQSLFPLSDAHWSGPFSTFTQILQNRNHRFDSPIVSDVETQLPLDMRFGNKYSGFVAKMLQDLTGVDARYYEFATRDFGAYYGNFAVDLDRALGNMSLKPEQDIGGFALDSLLGFAKYQTPSTLRDARTILDEAKEGNPAFQGAAKTVRSANNAWYRSAASGDNEESAKIRKRIRDYSKKTVREKNHLLGEGSTFVEDLTRPLSNKAYPGSDVSHLPADSEVKVEAPAISKEVAKQLGKKVTPTLVKKLTNTILTGYPTVVDGDSLVIRNTPIRLIGVDAPEKNQTCIANGEEYKCGETSLKALKLLIGDKKVTCEDRGSGGYGRTLGLCAVDGVQISPWLAQNGHAVAYKKFGKEMVFYQNLAKDDKVGLWAEGVTFQMPWDFRKHGPDEPKGSK